MTFTKIWCLSILKIKNRHFIKSGDVKTLQKNIQELFPSSNQLFGKRDKIEKGTMEDGTTLYFINGELVLFEIGGRLVPFLRVLLKKLILLPKVTIDTGGVPYIANGADVMLPGIVAVDMGIEKDDYVVVVDENHNKALAVGLSLLDGGELSSKKKGKGVKNLHYVGDRYWTEFLKLFK